MRTAPRADQDLRSPRRLPGPRELPRVPLVLPDRRHRLSPPPRHRALVVAARGLRRGDHHQPTAPLPAGIRGRRGAPGRARRGAPRRDRADRRGRRATRSNTRRTGHASGPASGRGGGRRGDDANHSTGVATDVRRHRHTARSRSQAISLAIAARGGHGRRGPAIAIAAKEPSGGGSCDDSCWGEGGSLVEAIS